MKTRVMDASVVSLVPAAERRLKAFQELMADSFLGIRFVPRLGREAAAEFERLGFREKVFEALEEALKKAWEANDEVCKNTSVGALPVGTSALASAVSDPTAQDCPLVYISAGFEELTGFKACWALGRNCRFLQPQQAGNAPMAVNRSEVERMRTFCKAGSGSMIVLLLNESAAGQYFWNLLFMQHLFLGRRRAEQSTLANVTAILPHVSASCLALPRAVSRQTKVDGRGTCRSMSDIFGRISPALGIWARAESSLR